MNLEDVNVKAKEFRASISSLIEEYTCISNYLKNIYGIVSAKDINLCNNVEDLIREYNAVINTLNSVYLEKASKIVGYVDKSNANLDQLLKDVRNIMNNFSSSAHIEDEIDTLY